MEPEPSNRPASEIAHEIRNALGVIKGFSSLLQRDLEKDSEQYQYTSYILEAVEKINQVLKGQ